VKELVRVRFNGTDLGVVWCEPWRLEISDDAKPGDNQLPAALRRTQTNIPVDPKQALLPAGLLGPVRVLAESRD